MKTLHLFWLVASLVVSSLFPTTESLGRVQEVDWESLPMSIPEGWKQLPDWAAKDLPFDATQYYGISDEQNRQALYLKSFMYFQFGESSRLLLDVEKYEEQVNQRLEREREQDRKFYEFYDSFLKTPQANRDAEMIATGRRLMKPYARGIELLKSAQQIPDCFFPVVVDTDALTPVQVARDVARKLSVQCNLDLNAPTAIDCLELTLRLQRDIKPMGEMITQLVASGIEGICYDNMVIPILENATLTTDQLDRLIDVLKQHRDSIRRIDPLVEAARYEHLMFKRLFHELATESYLPREQANEIWGDDLPRAILVIRELTQFCFYEASSEEVDNAIDIMAAGNEEIAQAAKKAKQSAKELRDPSALNTMVLAPLLFNVFETITEEDFQAEMKVLSTRCHQIEAASKLPFPGSTKTLLQLQNNWTTDDSWKSTKILKWFSPHNKLVSVRTRSHLRTNVLICMAAVRRWQLQHSGENPNSLEAALAAASIVEIPTDPHSGHPLKLLVGEKVLIYSVGPDEKDDLAKQQVEYWVTSPDDRGDIVLELRPLSRKR